MRKEPLGGLLRHYLRDRLPMLGLTALFSAVFASICFLMSAPLEGVVYALILCLAVLLTAMAVDFPRYLRKHMELEDMMERCLYGASLLPQAQGLIEEDWRKLLLFAIDHSASDADAYARERRDRDAYFAMWAHQIKVPIAAMRLLLQSEPGSHSMALGAELFKVEQYVDMALGYARLNGPSTDFVLRPCDVNAVMVRPARRFAPLFIQKKLKLDYQPTALTALTDEKWLGFVLEQLLSNAVKYTSRGSVTLRADEQAQSVIVEDTGIGIAPEDLPRVFDHGFTGLNGREDKRATGIGLYLSKRILDKLGHGVRIESEVGRGTRVTVLLKRDSLEAE